MDYNARFRSVSTNDAAVEERGAVPGDRHKHNYQDQQVACANANVRDARELVPWTVPETAPDLDLAAARARLRLVESAVRREAARRGGGARELG